MANNYLQPVNDHFGYNSHVAKNEVEDIDDDTFLNSCRPPKLNTPRNNNSNTLSSSFKSTGRSTNPFEMNDVETIEHEKQQKHQILQERKREIEERTLNTTQRSLSLLYETEEVGKASATELAKQREQLENTSRQLDEINATLRFSQRHLNSLKSVFGGLKNYLAGNRDQGTVNVSRPLSGNNHGSQDRNLQQTKVHSDEINNVKYEDHPISSLRGSVNANSQIYKSNKTNPFQEQLEANLEEMCDNLSRLKGLATDMNREIESQNELLDNMNFKIDDVDLKMAKQNKEMNKLLCKK